MFFFVSVCLCVCLSAGLGRTGQDWQKRQNGWAEPAEPAELAELLFFKRRGLEPEVLAWDVLHARFFEANIPCSKLSKKSQNAVTLQLHKKEPDHKQIMEIQSPPGVTSKKKILPPEKKRDG